MSTGMIAAKYASALLKYVDETGGGEKVYRQVEAIDGALSQIMQLRQIVDDPVSISVEDKIKACAAVLGDEPMADELSRFLRLVIEKGRVQYLRLIFKSFLERYLKSRNIHVVYLTTAIESEELGQKITEIVKKRTGGSVLLRTNVDPDIIGGFVFRCEDLMLDASVKAQLDKIRQQFIEKNRRIV